jgi:hypothetical protein
MFKHQRGNARVLLCRWERAAMGHWPAGRRAGGRADWHSPWGSLEVEWSGVESWAWWTETVRYL